MFLVWLVYRERMKEERFGKPRLSKRVSFVLACRESVSSPRVLTLKRARWILESSSLLDRENNQLFLTPITLFSNQKEQNRGEEWNHWNQLELLATVARRSSLKRLFPTARINRTMNHLIKDIVNIPLIDNKSSLQVRLKRESRSTDQPTKTLVVSFLNFQSEGLINKSVCF